MATTDDALSEPEAADDELSEAIADLASGFEPEARKPEKARTEGARSSDARAAPDAGRNS